MTLSLSFASFYLPSVNSQVKQAERTAEQLMLAERLVGALQRENVRWAESMKTLKDQKATLPGDMLLTAAFIAYSMLLQMIATTLY